MAIYKIKNKAGHVTGYYCSFYYKDYLNRLKRHKKGTFKTSREAKDYEDNAKQRFNGDCSMSFRNLSSLYLDDYKTTRRNTTAYNCESTFNRYLLPTFGDLSVSEITAAMIKHWQTEMLKKGFKSSYVNEMNVHLSAFFNYCIKFYRLQQNPVRICGNVKKSAPDIGFWTLDEFNRFIVKVTDSTMRLCFNILFYGGLRVGELLALTPSDFDSAAGTVRITKTYARLHRADHIHPPKTPKGNRTVSLPETICEMLRKHMDAMYCPGPDERLFTTISAEKIGRALKRCAAAAGVHEIRVHDLRHSHASLLISLGFSPLIIRDRLGHENIQTTLQVYSHLYPGQSQQVALTLDKVVQGEQLPQLPAATEFPAIPACDRKK